MNILAATADYERWLQRSFEPVTADLTRKHALMRGDRFTFLRATFYRWAQHWNAVPRPVRRALSVLAVGDAHVENFGTWRDAEGRLVWGTNDFDEAAYLPFTQDLVRLATSAVLAQHEGQLFIDADRILAAVLVGYESALRHSGGAIVLDAGNRWLAELVSSNLRDPVLFWERLLSLSASRKGIPDRVQAMLSEVPSGAHRLHLAHRTSGVGSLGRPRFVALYLLDGGYIAREAKARAPSAWHWAMQDSTPPRRDPLPRVWQQAIRSQDPFLRASRRWLVRRLAPDCSRIGLASIPKWRKEVALLNVMGWEIANVHLGSAQAAHLQSSLAALGQNWLPEAVDTMIDATLRDFRDWKRHR